MKTARTASLAVLAAFIACEPESADLPLAPETSAAQQASAVWSDWSEPVLIEAVNTPAREMAPTLSKDGLSLYFHSNRADPLGVEPPLAVNNIWVARRACLECAWQLPEKLGEPVNTVGFSSAAPALSRDGHWLFFNSNRRDPGWQGFPDIWVSYRQDVHDEFGWGTPVNLGIGINSSRAETQAGFFENDGGAPQLFFTRNNLGQVDIHVSEMLPDGTWGPAMPVVELNSDSLDARPSIHPNGLEIYFFSHRDDHRLWHATRPSVDAPWSPPVRLEQFTPGEASVFQPSIHAFGYTETLLMGGVTAAGAQEIYISTRTRAHARLEVSHASFSTTWSASVSAGDEVNASNSALSPFLTADGLTLYFAAQRPDGFGSWDIWVADRESLCAPFGTPVNLGPSINTAAREQGPFVSRDGHLLFFSRGNAVMTDVDIYVTRRTRTHDDLAWQVPVPLGPDVNTSLAESEPWLALGPGGHTLYFDRGPGNQEKDFYMAPITREGETLAPAVPVTELNSAGVTPLGNEDGITIRQDGREAIFASRRFATGGAELFRAERSNPNEQWGAPQLITELNSSRPDLHPALAADGRSIAFSSPRSGPGQFRIYTAMRGPGTARPDACTL